MLIKKAGRWNPNVKMKFRRTNRRRLKVFEDNLRNAKQPPEWMRELLFSDPNENFTESKTA